MLGNALGALCRENKRYQPDLPSRILPLVPRKPQPMGLLHRHKALLHTSTHQKHHPRRTNENPFRRPRRNQTVLESTVILKAQKAFCTQTSRPGKQPLPLRHNSIRPESPWPFSPRPCRRRKQIDKVRRIHHASLRMLRHRILLRSLQDRAHRR